MEVQLACIADAANISQEGKLNILGEFNTLWAQELPVTWPLMVFVAKIALSAADGLQIRFSMRVVSEDGQLVSPQAELQLNIHAPPPAGETPHVPLILPIGNAEFSEFGTYTFELRGNGRLLTTFPLHVRERPAQAPQPPPGG